MAIPNAVSERKQSCPRRFPVAVRPLGLGEIRRRNTLSRSASVVASLTESTSYPLNRTYRAPRVESSL